MSATRTPRRSGSVVRHLSARGVVWRLRYPDATGRRVCETLGLASDGWTQRRAEEALRERLVDVKRERLAKARPLRFEEFAKQALTDYLDTKGRRHSTRSGYLAVLTQHLVPYFGRMQLDAIESADVDAYIARKRRAGLEAGTVNRHLNVLRRVCKLAVRAAKMRTNPVLSVDPLDHRRRSRYQGDGERVSCHPQKGSALDHKRYAETFRTALVAAEITDYVRPFHDGRHSAITNDAAAGNSGLAVMRRAGHSDFRVTQMYLDLAGVEFADEAERAAARIFAHVPRAKVRATEGAG